MWDCPTCGESIEESFGACWKCGTFRFGGQADDKSTEQSLELETVPSSTDESSQAQTASLVLTDEPWHSRCGVPMAHKMISEWLS